jgi:hypothetical protein
MADEFFESGAVAPAELPKEEVVKIKAGGAEYTQDELDKLVDLGKVGLEAEEKYDRSIKTMYPDYQRTLRENERLQKQLDETESKIKSFTLPGAELTEEQMAEQAVVQARKLGLVTQDDVNIQVARALEAKEIIDEVKGIVKQTSTDGKPQTSVEELLRYMNDEGIKNPESAYKLMKESELKSWEKTQIEKIKAPAMVTDTSSIAGGKQPAEVKPTKENLKDLVHDYLTRQGQ